MQVTWPFAVRRIDDALKICESIAWTRGPPDQIRARVGNSRVITAVI